MRRDEPGSLATQRIVVEPRGTGTGLADSDEIDLLALAAVLWRQRGIIAGFALAAFMLVAAWLFAQGLFSADRRVAYPISLVFLNEAGEYPNGTPFSPRDLSATPVLDAVLQEFPQFKLTGDSLRKAVSVSYSNALLDEGQARLAKMVADKQTPEAVRDATREALADMRAASMGHLTVRLDLAAAGLTSAQGSKVVSAVVDTWAQQAVRRGLLNVNINHTVAPFEPPETQSLLSVYDDAATYLRSLQDTVTGLRRLSGTDSLIVNGETLADVARNLNILSHTTVGPLRSFAYSNASVLSGVDPAMRVVLSARLRMFALEHQRLNDLIASYDRTIRELGEGGMNVGTVMPTADRVAPTAQFDQSFLNSVLSLGEQLGNVKLRERLFNERLAATEQILALEKEIAVIKGDHDADASAAQSPQMYLNAALPDVVLRLNHIQQQLNQFVATYRNQALRSSGQLFVADSAPDVRGGLKGVARAVGVKLAMGVVLGLMLGTLFALLRGALAGRRTSIA